MKKSLFCLILWFLIFGLWSMPKTVVAQNGAVITVTPITDEFEIVPGKTLDRFVRVINSTSATLTLYPKVFDFHTDNENGQPVFFSRGEKHSSYSMSEWIKFSKPFIRVAANADERYSYTVEVPATVEPGGKYAALFFSTEPPELDKELSQVGVVGMVGTLLLARASGDVRESLTLVEFGAPIILFGSPANFSLLFNNTGNVHVKPQGAITIRNWSGEITKTITINEGLGNVLPESQRRFPSRWEFDWRTVGRYRAQATIAYGNPEKLIVAERTFYVVPWWLLVIVAALFVLTLALAVRRKRINGQRIP